MEFATGVGSQTNYKQRFSPYQVPNLNSLPFCRSAHIDECIIILAYKLQTIDNKKELERKIMNGEPVLKKCQRAVPETTSHCGDATEEEEENREPVAKKWKEIRAAAKQKKSLEIRSINSMAEQIFTKQKESKGN